MTRDRVSANIRMLGSFDVHMIAKAITRPGDLDPDDMVALKRVDPELARAALQAWRRAVNDRPILLGAQDEKARRLRPAHKVVRLNPRRGTRFDH